MLFRRLFLCALAVGLLTGLFDSLVQRWQVIPLIAAAEMLESAATPATPATPALAVAPAPPIGAHTHAAGANPAHVHAPVQAQAHEQLDGAAHSHTANADAWAPQAGVERTAYTVLANVLNAIGTALLLLALMAFAQRQRAAHGQSAPQTVAATVRHGLLWGASAWVCLFALPALGLPPELPGMQAAALHARQLWWALAAACGAGGLSVLFMCKSSWRVLGLALLVLPFVIGAPEQLGSPFAGLRADAAVQLQALAKRFAWATAMASALQSLMLGVLCFAAAQRWLNPLLGAATPTTMTTESAR